MFQEKLSQEKILEIALKSMESERRKLHEIRRSIERCEREYSIFLVKADSQPQ